MAAPQTGDRLQPQIQPCRYKVGKTLGAGSYSVVKECVHIDTGRYYAAKVINKRLMAGREHMVRGMDPFHTPLLASDCVSPRYETRSLCSRRYQWVIRTSLPWSTTLRP